MAIPNGKNVREWRGEPGGDGGGDLRDGGPPQGHQNQDENPRSKSRFWIPNFYVIQHHATVLDSSGQ